MMASAKPSRIANASLAPMLPPISAKVRSIRLYYGAYFAAMGLILPFFPLWLQQQGLNLATIGIMTGLLAAGKIIAPPIAGWLADHGEGKRLIRMISMSSMLAALLALLWPWIPFPTLLAAAILLFSLLWASSLPLADQLALSISESGHRSYGRLRAFGSLGFVVASSIGGWVFRGANITTLPWWIAAMMLVTAIAGRGFPQTNLPPHQPHHTNNQPPAGAFGRLITTGFLMQASHGAYYGFFSLYLLQLGYSSWHIGIYWVIGVLAEVVLMWLASDWLHASDPRKVLTVCLLLAAVRWVGIGAVSSWWGLGLLQLLHAASFAAFHITALVWVQRWAPRNRAASAQGWFSATGFGLGSTVGIMGCGWLVKPAGYHAIWWLCAALALAAIPFVLGLPKHHATTIAETNNERR
ncbi:MAG: MFS transporter [Mariprofundales bacterium]|nr:MFS transporter [Mariprofundales bacterium]